jgi:hypothetical protein
MPVSSSAFPALPPQQSAYREEAPVDEKAVPVFEAGKELRDRLNRGGMKRRT